MKPFFPLRISYRLRGAMSIRLPAGHRRRMARQAKLHRIKNIRMLKLMSTKKFQREVVDHLVSATGLSARMLGLSYPSESEECV